MSNIVKILKNEYGKSDNAVDNRIFQHRNLDPRVKAAYTVKLMRAIANCRTAEELKIFFARRYEMDRKYKEILI